MTTRERERDRETEPDEDEPAPASPATAIDTTQAAADTTRYSQQDVGRIMALASELQARDRTAKSDAAGLDRQQMRTLASELGIEPQYLETALAVARQSERAILIAGSIGQVRATLVKHFSGVCVSQPMENTVAPHISMEEPASLLVDWAGRALRLSLHEGPEGKTIVSWEARLAPSEGKMLATKIGGSILVAATAITAACGLGVVAGLFVACAGCLYAVEKTELSENTRDFAEFCRTHLENVQLVAGSEQTSTAPTAPAARPAAGIAPV